MRAFVCFLPILQFFTLMRDHRIASLTIGASSVQITADTSRSTPTYTDQYQLVAEDSKGLYHYLYVHSVQHGSILLMVYSLSADKQQCHFFSEVNIYPTLADCKKANAPLDPQKRRI